MIGMNKVILLLLPHARSRPSFFSVLQPGAASCHAEVSSIPIRVVAPALHQHVQVLQREGQRQIRKMPLRYSTKSHLALIGDSETPRYQRSPEDLAASVIGQVARVQPFVPV